MIFILGQGANPPPIPAVPSDLEDFVNKPDPEVGGGSGKVEIPLDEMILDIPPEKDDIDMAGLNAINNDVRNQLINVLKCAEHCLS